MAFRWRLTPLFFMMAMLLFQGCGHLRKRPLPMGSIAGVPGHFRMGHILDLRAGRAVSFEELVDRLAAVGLVFIGERHDNPEHHLIQVQVLQALKDRLGPFDLAMEIFQRPHQVALDRYLRGETTEEAFIEEIDWTKSWGHDYAFYRPLLQWARQNRARILAVNAPMEVVRKVARQGLESLAPAERDAIARDADLSNSAHRNYLKAVFEQHRQGDLKTFDFFYEAQCVWEETMAESIADHLRQKGGKLVAFVGNGHLVNRFGIPERIPRRIHLSIATLMPYPISKRETIEREVADYVWLTAEATPRFGMFPGMKEMKRTPEIPAEIKPPANAQE